MKQELLQQYRKQPSQALLMALARHGAKEIVPDIIKNIEGYDPKKPDPALDAVRMLGDLNATEGASAITTYCLRCRLSVKCASVVVIRWQKLLYRFLGN